jgi:nucleoside-diphosphate-sugar epimerase
MRLFVFGLGYTARVFARRLAARGFAIAGTARTSEQAAQLTRDGIKAFAFSREEPLPAAALAGTTHLLASIPPDDAGDPALDRHAADIARLPGLAWAGYLSTTGVYGDRGGDWVDEDSALVPTGARSARRVAAEAGWRALRGAGLPAHVFRLAGIYGPDRSAFDQLRAGTAKRIVKPGQVFSRIHVADIATVLEASIARPEPGTVYNVCDDEPAPPQDVVAFATMLAGVKPLPEIAFADAAPTMSPMALSFFADNRRVRNSRIKERLGVQLTYPDYRMGLWAIHEEDRVRREKQG